MNSAPRIVTASPDHAQAIADLLLPYVPQGLVLPRSPEEIRARHDDFLVALSGEVVVGAVSLRDFGVGLFEIRSLVVSPDYAGHGLGSDLVVAATCAAVDAGGSRVFALTMRPRLFARLGFAQVPMDLFPQKVWLDCAKCPKQDHCDETALMLEGDDLDAFVAQHSS
jgi:amino-acid N-acetyltransferase